MRRADRDGIDALACFGPRRRQPIARRMKHRAGEPYRLVSGRELRILRRDAHDMKSSDRASRGRRRAHRLQPVFVDLVRQSGEGDDTAAGRFTEPRAQHRPERVLVDQSRIECRGIDLERGAAIFGEMQAALRRAARQRGADVEEIAVTLAARAEHGIAEGDGVAFAPGDMLAERRPMARLIGRAGPGRPAAELEVGVHHAPRHRRTRRLEPHAAGMKEIERADIERGRHGDGAAAFDQPLGEQRAGSRRDRGSRRYAPRRSAPASPRPACARCRRRCASPWRAPGRRCPR